MNINDDSFGDFSQYRELNAIGTGAYGTVYKAEDMKNNIIVAMKKVRIALTEDGVPMTVLREISLLRHLGKYNHPNIVQLNDICHGPHSDREMSLYLVFEHMDQDLNSYISKCPPPGLESNKIRDLMWQILCGVDFLHSQRIVHRDIKPQNILLSHNGTLKLADFGLARIYDFNALLTTTVVTLWYRAPEVLLGTSYATPVDIWSIGCIFAELFNKRPIFPGQNEVDQLVKIFELIGTPSDTEWPDASALLRHNFVHYAPKPVSELVNDMDENAKDLLEQMLKFNPNQRITASEALSHPYFADYGSCPHDSSSSTSSSFATPSKTSSDQSRLSNISDSSMSLNSSHDTSTSSS